MKSLGYFAGKPLMPEFDHQMFPAAPWEWSTFTAESLGRAPWGSSLYSCLVNFHGFPMDFPWIGWWSSPTFRSYKPTWDSKLVDVDRCSIGLKILPKKSPPSPRNSWRSHNSTAWYPRRSRCCWAQPTPSGLQTLVDECCEFPGSKAGDPSNIPWLSWPAPEQCPKSMRSVPILIYWDVSWNGRTPKWRVYDGKSVYKCFQGDGGITLSLDGLFHGKSP